MGHPDANAESATEGIASGTVQYGVTLAVAAEINARSKSANILKLFSDGIGMATNRLRSSRITFNAGINMRDTEADFVTTAFQPAQTNSAFSKRNVFGLQEYRSGCGIRYRRALHHQKAQWALQTRGF